MNRSSFIALGVILSGMTGVAPAWAQTSEIERSGQDNITIPPFDPEQSIPDLSLHYNNLSNLDASGLDTADGISLETHQQADEIGEAYRQGRYRDVLEALAENPGITAARPEVKIFEAWSQFQLGNTVTSLSLFETLYKEDPNQANAYGVIYSGVRSERFSRVIRFTRANGGTLEEWLRPDEPIPADYQAVSELDQLRYGFHRDWLLAAVKYKKIKTAKSVARHLGVDDAHFLDAGVLINMGWAFSQAKQPEAAIEYFQRAYDAPNSTTSIKDDARYGIALALNAQGLEDATLVAIGDHADTDPRLGGLYSEIILARGYEAFEKNDFAASLSLAQEAQTAVNILRKAQLLEGWSLIRLGRHQEAADHFGTLYVTSPDQESADGLKAALTSLNQLESLREYAAQVDGPLATSHLPRNETVVGIEDTFMNTADAAFYRKLYLRAAEINETKYAHRAQVGVSDLSYTMRYVHRDGAQGTSQLDYLSSKYAVYGTRGVNHFSGSVEFLEIDSGGQPSADQPIGSSLSGDPDSALFTARPMAIDDEDTIIIPTLSWRREGPVEVGGSIGLAAVSAKVKITPVGHLAARKHFRRGTFEAGVYRRPIFESQLSLAGLEDPATGQAFGRVIETGLRTDLYYQLNGSWSTNAHVRWGMRDGKNVQDNDTVSANFGVGYNFPHEKFEYISVGPTYRFETFDHNLSGFTLGHGGYYSPSELHEAGMGLNFLTKEDRRFIVRGNVSLGYQTADQDAAPDFPLAEVRNDTFFSASSSSGFAPTGQVQAAWLVSDRFILEGGAYGLDSDDYSEYGAFVKIRIPFGKRSALFVHDLTEAMFRF